MCEHTCLALPEQPGSRPSRPAELPLRWGRAATNAVHQSWFEIDDVFFEACGQTWALIHLLKAVEHDFGPVLDDKNARVSLRQIIRELEATQEPIWSPMILNGGGFGFPANHSLVMASCVSRANAALLDLSNLLPGAESRPPDLAAQAAARTS